MILLKLIALLILSFVVSAIVAACAPDKYNYLEIFRGAFILTGGMSVGIYLLFFI